MQSSKLLLTFAVLCSVQQFVLITDAACICNEPGVDHCAPCNENRIVRPKQKPSLPPMALPPIGDNCWCNKLLVEPAALPKTCEKHKTPQCKCKRKSAYRGNALPPAPQAYDIPVYNNPPPNYYEPSAQPGYDSPPADPVSISLAVQAGKAISVPEAKLAFGFVQKPLDDLQGSAF